MKNKSAITSKSTVSLRKITSETVYEICELSETLTDQQRNMIADNGTSIAEAHFSDYAWFRAIYADEIPAGFLMLHYPSLDNEDSDIDVDSIFLWRFMVAHPYQSLSIGKKAIKLIAHKLKVKGFSKLYVSCVIEEGSPYPFYRKLGFMETGEVYENERELVLNL